MPIASSGRLRDCRRSIAFLAIVRIWIATLPVHADAVPPRLTFCHWANAPFLGPATCRVDLTSAASVLQVPACQGLRGTALPPRRSGATTSNDSRQNAIRCDRCGSALTTPGGEASWIASRGGDVIRRPNVLGVSCTAGSACRSRRGAAVAAHDVRRTESRTATAVTPSRSRRRQAARLPGRSRAVPASHQSWAATSSNRCPKYLRRSFWAAS